MRIRFPSKASIVCTFKVIGGSTATLAAVLSGQHLCPPNIFCMDLGFYMRIHLWSLSITMLAAGLLLSAFRDLVFDLGTIELLERDIEAVADPINEDLILHFGLEDA